MTKRQVTLDHEWFDRPLPENLVLHDEAWLYSSFAFLHCASRADTAVKIGRKSAVYDSCMFELGPRGWVEIGEYSAIVGAIFATDGAVRIGSYCLVSSEVLIADSPFVRPWHPATEDAAGEPYDCVVLGDDVWIGTRAMLLRGARIGDGSIVGAGAVVDFEVPPRAIVAGNPARIVRFLD